MSPTPIVPDYAGANVRGIVPALLGPSTWNAGLPDWMPPLLADADQIVLLVLDGLGWDQLQEHAALMPVLSSLTGERITTVAPTTTSTALSSIATGLTPGEHGLIGYRIVVGGEILNVLRWAVNGDDRRRAFPPADVQRFPAFMLQEQGHKLEDDIIVAVKGRLDKRDESRFGLIAQDIQVLAGLAENAAAALRLAIPSHALDELRIQRLKRILRDHPGDSVVLIELGRGKVLRLSDEFRVDIDRAVGELRMAFGHEAVLLS